MYLVIKKRLQHGCRWTSGPVCLPLIRPHRIKAIDAAFTLGEGSVCVCVCVCVCVWGGRGWSGYSQAGRMERGEWIGTFTVQASQYVVGIKGKESSMVEHHRQQLGDCTTTASKESRTITYQRTTSASTQTPTSLACGVYFHRSWEKIKQEKWKLETAAVRLQNISCELLKKQDFLIPWLLVKLTPSFPSHTAHFTTTKS